MSTLKAINFQHPTAANANMTLTSNGSLQLGQVPFLEMTQTIAANYTINTGMNAFTPGPISVANGVSVTVPNGSFWIVS